MNRLLSSGSIKNAVFVNTLISSFAILLQLLLIAYVSRINPDYVAVIAIIEIITSITLAVSFFGGEQYFINFNNKKRNANSINILAFLLLVVFLISFLMYSVLSFLYLNDFIRIDIPKIKKEEIILLYFISIFFIFTFIFAAFFRAKQRFLLAVISEKI